MPSGKLMWCINYTPWRVHRISVSTANKVLCLGMPVKANTAVPKLMLGPRVLPFPGSGWNWGKSWGGV